MYICIIIINISYMKYRIKELCKEKGITLESLALGIGTSQASISRIITGNGNPTMDSLERIAKFLNVEVPELFLSLIHIYPSEPDHHQRPELYHLEKRI